MMHIHQGRLCKVSTVPAKFDAKVKLGAAPRSDNDNFANLLTDAGSLFGELEAWGGFPAKEYRMADLKITAL
jgi:hypothetical protein